MPMKKAGLRLCLGALFFWGCSAEAPEITGTGPDASVVDGAAPRVDGGASPASDGGNPGGDLGVNPRPDGGTVVPLRVPPGETIRLGDRGGYFDPEILQSPPKMTFTDGQRTIWVADLDPVTGAFVTPSGRDVTVDGPHAPLQDTNNGPEFGLDRDGWSIVYTKTTDDGYRLFRARPSGDAFQTAMIPSAQPLLGAVASKAPQALTTWALAIRGAWDAGDAVSLDLNGPDVIDRLQPAIDGRTDGRWIDDRQLAVYTIVEGPDAGQLGLWNPVDATSRTITDDVGEKGRPYGWVAPEAGGRLRALALIDGGRSLAVYEEQTSGPWPRVLTIAVPPAAQADRMSSPEPLVVQGRSFATVTVVRDNTRPRASQVWILDLGAETGAGPGTVRCDGGDDPAQRTEPETFVGAEQVFVYHYRVEPGAGTTLYRCASGLRTSGCPCQNGGQCLPMDRCACPSGFSGDRCEVEASTGLDFEAAARYSAARAGVALVVDVGGQTVFERYERGFGPDDAHHLFSATKAFWAVAAAAAVDDGLMTFDELISNTYPEWGQGPRSAVTMRHVLTLSSGLRQDPDRLQGEERSTHAADKYAHARSLGLRCQSYPCANDNWVRPGTDFNYGPVDYYVFGGVLKTKLQGEDPLAYLDRRVFRPIGLEWARWVRDGEGQAHLPNGAYLTAREWVKFGRLIVNAGTWDGQTLIQPSTLAELFVPSALNPGHGLFVWMNRPGGEGFVGMPPAPGAPGGFLYHGGYPDMVAGVGAGRNAIYVFPTLDMVVVRQCEPLPGSDEGFGCEPDFVDFWTDPEFFRALFGE